MFPLSQVGSASTDRINSPFSTHNFRDHDVHISRSHTVDTQLLNNYGLPPHDPSGLCLTKNNPYHPTHTPSPHTRSLCGSSTTFLFVYTKRELKFIFAHFPRDCFFLKTNGLSSVYVVCDKSCLNLEELGVSWALHCRKRNMATGR
jgi:hypothetical protein